jgi:hypothetical protein
MDARYKELADRLVAPGNPHSKFSCSEFHELYGFIMEDQEKLKKSKPKKVRALKD